MRTTHALWQKTLLCPVLFVATLAFILATCGTKSSGTVTGPTPSSIPTTIPTIGIVPGYGTAYGCPSDVVVSAVPPAPDITVDLKQGNTTIKAHVGDVMEIQMPFGLAWKGPTTSQGVLQLQPPSGFAWKPSSACIWRFVAKKTGTVELTFFGRAICKKVSLCVPSVEIALFTIKVG